MAKTNIETGWFRLCHVAYQDPDPPDLKSHLPIWSEDYHDAPQGDDVQRRNIHDKEGEE